MKIYHLADLHFGKTIYGVSMLKDQKDWANKFLKLCGEERPDAVLIAGDVYDRSAPSGDAVELLDYFLTSLAEQRIPVFLIAGNHDSGQRLSFAHTLLEKEYIHISGCVGKELKHYTFENPDGNGPLTVWMLPYTYPEQISVKLYNDNSGDEDFGNDASGNDASGNDASGYDDSNPDAAGTQEDSQKNVSFRSYDDAVRTILKMQQIDTSNRNIILSHQNVTANGEEAERGGSESMVGGVGQIDFGAYEDFDYVALGHIHSSYHVGRETVRYAGTPICYHFNETRQLQKGVTEVILGAKQEEIQIRMIPIEPLHRMRYLTDTKDNVYKALTEEMGENEYVSVVLKDTRIKPEIYSYIKEKVESKGGILMECLSDYYEFSDDVKTVSAEAVKEKPLEDLFAALYTDRRGGTPPGDDTYEVLEYVGEMVRRQDTHADYDPGDVTKIVNKAKSVKEGGKTE